MIRAGARFAFDYVHSGHIEDPGSGWVSDEVGILSSPRPEQVLELLRYRKIW
jgi:hypothetical protein